ncbi:unnamed protein product [Acanthoscelides obtectus]|uniref:Histone-lysine N-methyltransferase, H3 lysine-36 and H4 lysine-20 specific n=3 Tax=Acanthoscelides obtectus TaxID=200917 RepID=A0A9P0P4A2_ACAOB|nr:unnamed protein product [Acanthoscelides obtectus]CAK1623019.1 Histone-lysine N-methyltransferase, H3 lysine-36 and H4 lysine-20 specific [Acanthoscelides obtectus]
MRSRSLEVRNSCNDNEPKNNDLSKIIITRSLSQIDHGNSSSKENILNSISEHKHSGALVIEKNDGKFQQSIKNKILKVVVVPMKNLTLDGRAHGKTIKHNIEPSSHLSDHRTTKNNLIELEPHNGIERNTQSNDVVQNCNSDSIVSQNQELVSLDKPFVQNDIPNVSANESLPRKANRKKTDDKSSFEFVSPRLQAKQLQQMGLITEDTSFAFYSAVDSVLAEIKVSQKQHKLNSQERTEYTEKTEEIIENGHKVDITEETKPVDVSTVSYATATRTENLMKSSNDQNDDEHEDTGITKNKKSRISFQSTSVGSRNSDASNTEQSLEELIVDRQQFCKDNGAVVTQNSGIHETTLDITASNKLTTSEIAAKSAQTSVGGILVHLSNERKDVEGLNVHCTSHISLADKLDELKCDTGNLNFGENMPPIQRRDRPRKLCEDTILKEQRAEESSLVVMDSFSRTKRKGSTRISIGSMENSIVSIKKNLSQVHSNIGVTENSKIKRGKGRPRKSKNSSLLKETIVSLAENTITVNKESKTYDAPLECRDIINETLEVIQRSASRNFSPETRITRSRSQELVEMHDPVPNSTNHYLLSPEYSIVHGENSFEHKLLQISESSSTSSKANTSVRLTEIQRKSVGDDQKTQQSESGMHTKRGGMTYSYELTSKSNANLDRLQTDSELDISAVVPVMNKTSTKVSPDSVELEKNNKQIGYHKERFDLDMDYDNKTKSIEKWVKDHVELVNAVSKSFEPNHYSETNFVTNHRIPKEKTQTRKESVPRRSLTRGRKLVAMLEDDNKESMTKETKIEDIRDNCHEAALQNTIPQNEEESDQIRRLARSNNSMLEQQTLLENKVQNDRKDFAEVSECTKSNPRIDEKSDQIRRSTRGSNSIEQQRLMEDYAQDANQNNKLENKQLVNRPENSHDTDTENNGNDAEAKSGDSLDETKTRSRMMGYRTTTSILLDREMSPEDTTEYTRRLSSASDDGQSGPEANGSNKIAPEQRRRPATSMRKKGKKCISASWSSRRSRSKSVCPSGSDMKSFKHGDLTWAQIGSYPYWPCMVRCAPNTTEVTKIYYIGRGIRTAYHVQFFGDQGRRAWINVTRIMPFNSSNDLKDMVERLAAEEGGYNMFYQPFMFKSRSKQVNKKLQVAADEAESMKSKTIEEKLKFFEDVINKQREGQSSCTKKVSSIKSAKSKRTSGDMECLPSMKIARVTEESTTKSRRTIKVGSTEESKQNEVLKAEGEEPDDNKKDIENTPKPAKLALMLPPLEELYSIEAQKTLFKRNNLFKGMSKDKVCHYCLEPGDVLRCSAKCNGIYHLECSRMVMYNKIGGKRQASLKCSPSMKSDGERSESGEADDSHVQIVTVQSSIYNTPPRKNFPPDFDSLSLAEQIDYKMKEVMRKFESKTTYANESSRSASASSEDNGSDEKVVIRHVAADSVIEEVVPKPKKAKNNVAVKLFSKLEEANENSDFKTPNNLLANRHVTADDVAFEALMADSKNFKCSFCLTDVEPNCFVCHERISSRGSEVRQKCSLYHCGRYFHPSCLKMWPQTQWSIIQLSKSKNVSDSFVCPQHVCHTCVSDDPRAATSRCSCDKIVKCMLCPRSYHSSNLCIPAGTKILSTSQIICPSHRKRANSLCINTTWCFLCSEGGNLICCETCPTSVHPECLPVNLTDDGKFICEDCESGRLPLYDEIVWVKLGHFRWWPAVILFPNEVPSNVNMVKHYTGDFVVRFFGTYNYYWVNRGRSFLFQDGDTGDGNNKIKKLDKEFKKAVEEATLAHKLKQEFKNTQQVESPSSQKPPPYIKIKVNKPVGNVRQLDLDLSNTTACNCDPNQENPCGPDSDCLNRLLMTECNPEVCPAGSRCRNQSFEKREYPPIAPYKTHARGWGLKTLMPIKKGQFVIEYVGEIIDTEEYQRRIQKMHEQKEENYYFLTIDNQRMLDAGPKGNLARFMNHCCQPNCETQKWTVKGETRVGLFATMDIPADTELTFNYNLECVGKEKKVCRCGAPNCSGFIGVKAKQDDLAKPVKVTKKKIYKKKRKLTEPVVSQPCFICNKKDNVFTCNNKICNKAYHLKCLKLDADNFDASRFICPWHSCDICSKRTIRCCVKCIRSYCPQHSDGKISHYSTVGFVCFKHDRMRYSRKDNINHATGQQSRSLSRNRKVNEAPLNLNKNMKRKKDKTNRTLLQHKGAFTHTSTTDTESDAPLSRRLKKIRPSIPMQTEATSGMPSSGYEEIDDIPLAQRLSSAISISKTPQPDTSKDEESNFEAVSEGAKNTTVDPAQSLREKQKYRNSEIETHLAATGSEIELCNVSETKATDETQTPSEESTVHIKDLPSSDSNTVASKTSTKEQSQDEVHDIENKQDIPKTKGQLKEYPINVEIDDSSEAAAYQHPTSIETENSNENDSTSKASQQDLNTEIKNSCEAVAVDDISERYVQRDDRAVTENHSELLKNSAPQSSKQGVDKSTSSIAKLAHMNDSKCNASPVQECGDKVESNLPNEASDDITSTSRPPVDNSESERTLDTLTEINGDLITEVDAELSSKLVSNNGLTDDSQDKGEKLEVKKRKRKSHRLNTRKKI